MFYQYYDRHPIGRATVINQERADITDLKISLFIRRYMDSPKTYAVDSIIKRGQTANVDLYALFTDSVLEITEGTTVSAEIGADYTVRGQPRHLESTSSLRLLHRNASIWDDDRRAAAFVTARDPAVLRFAKAVAGSVRAQQNQAVDRHLRTAMALHQVLHLHGVNYVVDPKTPYKVYVQNRQAVDYLQFPRQTLDYKAGDCDDLSILYNALLESVSVDTAFITVPGHIYCAFRLNSAAEEVRKTYQRPEDFIFREDGVWVPVEATEVHGGFLKAWASGAKTWREQAAAGQARFITLEEAWQVFAPVGLPGEAEGLAFPSQQTVQAAYLQEFDRLVREETERRVADMQRQIRQSGDNPKLINALGVLYARFGLTVQAEKEFARAVASADYLPALVNMGNALYIKKDFTAALNYFNRALRKDPNNSIALLNVARIAHEQQRYAAVKTSYDKLAQVAPALASEFKYLALQGDEAARAAEAAGAKEAMLWQE